MDSSYPGRSRQERDKSHAPPYEECDLSGIDDLACESKGVADRAKYIADHEAALTDRRTAYDTARAAYTTARTAVAADVARIRKDLHQIREQLRCQLEQGTVRCLDEAWDEVAERLERCGEPRTGCCVEECDVDAEREGYEDDDLDQLTARIARIDRMVTAAETCFGELAGEPAALTQRVAALRTAATALLTEISDPTTADPKHAYATLRWLWHRNDDIWWGFPRVHDFHNCLCQALTCSVTGRRVLGILVGGRGVLQCRKDAEERRCGTLRTQVVEEVLEACARACRSDGREDDKSPQEHRGGAQAEDGTKGGTKGRAAGEKHSGDQVSFETEHVDDREERPRSTW